jgi:hypothetical protein
MRQKLCKRLEDLERISAAAAARRVDNSADYERTIAAMMEEAHAWHADPVKPEMARRAASRLSVSQYPIIGAQLAKMAYGRSRSVHQGGH